MIVPGAQVGQIFEPKVVVGSNSNIGIRPSLMQPRFGNVDSNVTVPLSKLPPSELLKLAIDRYQTVIDLQRGQMLKQDHELSKTIQRYNAAAEGKSASQVKN